VGVVALQGVTQLVGLGVELLELREIRHWIESMSVVMRMEMRVMMTIMMSSS
jgi:hypothetical protein